MSILKQISDIEGATSGKFCRSLVKRFQLLKKGDSAIEIVAFVAVITERKIS